MKKIFFFKKIVLIYFFLTSIAFAEKSEFLVKGISLFNKNEFEKSKIVFNPKNDESYLYLAKIFNKNQNLFEEEINLNNVLLLNPKNDEAIYMLIMLKIKQSDYKEAKKLIEKFNLVCNSFCSKKNEIKKKFNKLIPENEKINN